MFSKDYLMNKRPAPECYFKENLNRIAKNLSTIHELCSIEGKWAEESVHRILSCSDHLPSQQAVELVHGLSELLSRLRTKLSAEKALIAALSDRNCVPVEVLLDLMQHEAMEGCPSGIHEYLLDSVPRHLLPE